MVSMSNFFECLVFGLVLPCHPQQEVGAQQHRGHQGRMHGKLPMGQQRGKHPTEFFLMCSDLGVLNIFSSEVHGVRRFMTAPSRPFLHECAL